MKTAAGKEKSLSDLQLRHWLALCNTFTSDPDYLIGVPPFGAPKVWLLDPRSHDERAFFS